MTLVDIKGLKVSFAQHGGLVEAVRGVSLHVNEGESLGIVGESGSGKSVTCMALMRLLAPTAKVSAESLVLDDVDVLKANQRSMSELRGRSAAMIFQDPMTAFDPVFTIGHQIVETIRTHRRASKAEALAEAEQLLRRVEILNAKDVLGHYPHQLSGGMLQRAMIAMALSCRPKLLIADEPTTALDVTIQAQILQLIKQLQAEVGMALIVITHDLGVIAETVDRVVVMYGGRVMEEGPVQQIFDAPKHSYTQQLLASLIAGTTKTPAPRGSLRQSSLQREPPSPLRGGIEGGGGSVITDGPPPPSPSLKGEGSRDEPPVAPALELRDLGKVYKLRRQGRIFSSYTDHHAVRDVTLTLPRNKIVGLVGESGSGKSTTGMMAMRLTEPTSGRIFVDGADISELDTAALKSFRRRMQVVFQDSYSALDPMMTLTQIIAEPLHIHGMMTSKEQNDLALDWLEKVGLDRSFGLRYPHELSGGQRQRVAIARALILGPSVLVADEPTSALDVTVKAQIIGLLKNLQREMGLSMLFISHDLSVVRSLTDTVVVMYRGRVVEQAPTAALFAAPQHPYTRALLDAIPATNPRERRQRTFLKAADIEAAMPRYAASSLAAAATPGGTPQLVSIAPGHLVEAIVTH